MCRGGEVVDIANSLRDQEPAGPSTPKFERNPKSPGGLNIFGLDTARGCLD